MRRMWTTTLLVFGLMAGPSTGQVSLELRSNSAETIELTEGQVEFDLAIYVDTTIDLDGLVFALQASDPELFMLGDPPVDIGGPFNAGELITPQLVAGQSLSEQPALGFFRASGKYTAAEFSGPLVTFHLRSTEALPAGSSYTFTTGGSGNDFIWTSSPDMGAFDSPGQFTLNVVAATPEPAPQPEPQPEPEPELPPQERLANLIKYLRIAAVLWIIFILL